NPLTITFDASKSEDRNFDPMSFFWDFSDGTNSTEVVNTRFFDTGAYFVTLDVTDPIGLSDKTGMYLFVSEDNPNNTKPSGSIYLYGYANSLIFISGGQEIVAKAMYTYTNVDTLNYIWPDKL